LGSILLSTKSKCQRLIKGEDALERNALGRFGSVIWHKFTKRAVCFPVVGFPKIQQLLKKAEASAGRVSGVDVEQRPLGGN